MGRWMRRVAEPGKIGKAPVADPSKPSKPPFDGFEGSPSGPSGKIGVGFEGFEGSPEGVFEKFTAPDSVEIEERAALTEDGGIPRAWADGLARLATMPPPDGWGADWRAVRDGALRFADDLAGQWLAKAVALGWTEVDLFGAAPTAPAARLDARGAATFIKGASTMAITADAIVIRTPSGQRLRITRPTTKGGVPLWEVR